MKSADRSAFPDVILVDNTSRHVRDLSIGMSSSHGGEDGARHRAQNARIPPLTQNIT